jgi:hypothetical protein
VKDRLKDLRIRPCVFDRNQKEPHELLFLRMQGMPHSRRWPLRKCRILLDAGVMDHTTTDCGDEPSS